MIETIHEPEVMRSEWSKDYARARSMHCKISPPDHGPWFLRWINPELDQRGEIELTDVDSQANPMDRDEANELCRYQARKYPIFIWFVSNERANKLVLP